LILPSYSGQIPAAANLGCSLIAERTGMQTIVLDNKGEFASLREVVDVPLVGASGELAANPRHATLLCAQITRNSRFRRWSSSTS
jgi:hypothetical protein